MKNFFGEVLVDLFWEKGHLVFFFLNLFIVFVPARLLLGPDSLFHRYAITTLVAIGILSIIEFNFIARRYSQHLEADPDAPLVERKWLALFPAFVLGAVWVDQWNTKSEVQEEQAEQRREEEFLESIRESERLQADENHQQGLEAFQLIYEAKRRRDEDSESERPTTSTSNDCGD